MKHNEAQLKQILSSVKKNNEKNATIAPHAQGVQEGLDHEGAIELWFHWSTPLILSTVLGLFKTTLFLMFLRSIVNIHRF